ncbi:MAG: response regulator [Nitrososphaeraceae archaeon]|nr:response regulator [Nitrososphaeraceae archaeon]
MDENTACLIVMPPNNKLWRFFLILTNNSNYYNHNNSILLVDDEKDILNLFCACLQKFGYETIPFNNPVDALNYINTSNISNCSLIITDYKMPQMSGIDLIKKIRENDLIRFGILVIINKYITITFNYTNNRLYINKFLLVYCLL